MKSQIIFVLFAGLVAVAPGHARADERSLKTANVREDVQASVDSPDRTHKGSIKGTVIDVKGKPVKKAKVELTDPVTKEQPLSVMTDKRGQYMFSGLLPGVYSIQAKKGGMQSGSVDIKVTNGQNDGPQLALIAKVN